MQRKKDTERAIENHSAILKAVRENDINKGKQAIEKAVQDW